VQIGAGSLGLVGRLLGIFLAPWCDAPLSFTKDEVERLTAGEDLA